MRVECKGQLLLACPEDSNTQTLASSRMMGYWGYGTTTFLRIAVWTPRQRAHWHRIAMLEL